MEANIIKAESGSPEWHAVRASGIGGSDAAAILGLSKWKSPYRVWQEKRGEAPPLDDNWAMRHGRHMEPLIRQDYADRTGREVRLLEGVMRHEKYPFMLGNFDGLTDCPRVVEIKTSRIGKDWGEPGSDQVPQDYMIQVQHYLAITGFDVADVTVSIAGGEPQIYEVPADRELQQMIIEGEADFWRMVREGTPPAPRSSDDVRAMYGRSKPNGVVADEPTLDTLARLIHTKETLSALLDEKEGQETLLKIFMAENDTLLDSGGKALVTWKESKPAERFDAASLKLAHPELYRQFVKAGEPSRRFLIK